MKRLFFFSVSVLLLLILSPSASADSVTDTIGIYVGYYGWEAEDYVLKSEYSWYDLDADFGGCLDTDIYFYSNYSSHSGEGGRLMLTAARGFLISDLLEMGGIDFQSIARVDFFTKDVSGLNAWCSLSKYQLFDQARYYFPNLSAKENTGELFAWDGDDIWNGAVRVPSILALESYSEWAEPDETGVELCGSLFENSVDLSQLGPSSRFLLMFGQYDPTDAHTYNLAKYVYRINVTFSGTPVLSADETNIELKIGSAQKLEISIDAEDALLNDFVCENLEWSSSDESIVTVGSDGTVTVVGDGKAVITASFGESSVSVTVGTGKESAGVSGGTAVSGDSGTSGPAAVTPAAQSSSSESNPTQPEAESIPEPEEDPEEEQPSEELTAENEIEISEDIPAEIPPSSQLLLVSKEALAALIMRSEAADQASGGKMDDDSEQLILLEKDKTIPYTVLFCLILGSAFLIGFTGEIIRYKRLLGNARGLRNKENLK